mgnify:CR=1 FL=1
MILISYDFISINNNYINLYFLDLGKRNLDFKGLFITRTI